MAVKRKMNAHDKSLTSQNEEDLMTERSPFFMSIELKHVKQEEPADQDENIVPTTESSTPLIPREEFRRRVLTPRSPNAGTPKTRLPVKSTPSRANISRNVSQAAESLSRITAPPAGAREDLKSTPTATSAIEMALHIFAAFPLGHELYIGAERTFVKEKVGTMLHTFGNGYETQALWVAARLRERQVSKDHIEAVIERLMEVEAKEMAAWLQTKVKDVLLMQNVCRRIVDAGIEAEAR
ncbi:hypothetical protein DOTSEDRAFT_57677 [Dothistroma septosporum NZE10]|uniref:Uncharacterized protein n=1 Tax=Dothistroma septosporum (strain NZE10 / CBS 128990) TaxID=675120 RepID=M2WHT2_DOTSN|nr:hypothetical protein DOTSEDRAFT_57677 [Dothistroma septosporum NZE10]